jgi:hypothetical protein
MTLIGWYILLSTFALGYVASIWSAKGWHNIAIKFAYVSLAVCGAIASATVLGLAS